MSDRCLTIGLIQHSCSDSPQHNLSATEDGVREAYAQGARLVLLQELHKTRYFCQTEDPDVFELAEPVPGPTTERLGVLAKELGVVVVASVFERRASGVYHNTAVVLENDGAIVGRYRKMHIPNDPGYHEKFYFTPGDLGFEPIETSVGRLGVLICWDQWYPEAARLMALAGAELLLFPTAIGYDESDDPDERTRQYEAWMTVQRSHAIANNLPLAACNRTGTEPDPSGRSGGIRFWGSSFVCGPQGELLARASEDTSAVITARIDLDQSERLRRIWPYFRDRRIDAYGDLARRYRD
ncbi:MAG: carbon-nitrogen hydrolase [Gammaproteobacteria bacterium]